jgi:hypothetical protein
MWVKAVEKESTDPAAVIDASPDRGAEPDRRNPKMLPNHHTKPVFIGDQGRPVRRVWKTDGRPAMLVRSSRSGDLVGDWDRATNTVTRRRCGTASTAP